MAVMAELHAAIFIEPRPADDCCREEEYQEERTTLFWDERKARSIELEQQQQLLKQRCSRVAELRSEGEETEALTPGQRRLIPEPVRTGKFISR